MLAYRKEKPTVIDSLPSDQVYCLLDYETYSEADIEAVGGYEYSMHPSTEILCLSFAVVTKKNLLSAKVKTWLPNVESSGLTDFINALTSVSRWLRDFSKSITSEKPVTNRNDPH